MNKIAFIVLTSIIISSCNVKPEEKSPKSEILNNHSFDSLLTSFNDSTEVARGQLLYKLVELDDPRIKPLLEKALFDKDEFVQIVAIQSINSNNLKSSSNKLLQLFNRTDNNTLISNLCRTFEDFNLKEAVPYVKEKTKSKNPMVVYDCILTLGTIGTESEIPFLKKLTDNKVLPEIYDENGFLSQKAEFTIGELAQKSIKKLKKASR